MELELESGGGGSRAVALSVDSPTADLGRGDLGGGGPSADRTRLAPPRVPPPSRCGVFRRGEKGELRPGDALSLSLKAPAFWAVRRREGNGKGEVEAAVLDAVARRERRTRERKEREREKQAAEEEAMEVTEEEKEEAAEGLDIDLASVDPVREFGFLSMGHEFDSYPKGRIRAPKDWNWFLEETKRTSDDEDDEISNRRGRSKGWGQNKKKKDGEGEDEDWTDESEDEKESLARGPGVKRSKYVTRSKGPKKPRQEISKAKGGDDDDEDEEVGEEGDEEDETLGGFVVNDDDDEPMEELSDEEDEEEEFDDEVDDD
ncbi:high mobility group nucleosome-binding domain-containing protein 5 [Panicum miliaceum]|uniref:High mobility group nucleosome-binding domain-containing protein 5 n=1 Tax=Panicum miliaceum TaxID=4540 RepID=A0A3L6PGN7_PANMI|nr:high mobility group nucleosome-binding domain-containing protein 5 [Panicum miliaceum]